MNISEIKEYDYKKLTKKELLLICDKNKITKCKSKNKTKLIALIVSKENAKNNNNDEPVTGDNSSDNTTNSSVENIISSNNVNIGNEVSININCDTNKKIINIENRYKNKSEKNKLITKYDIEYELNNNEINDDNLNDKQFIIDLFISNIKGKPILIKSNKHCGSEGHWLEKQMGLVHNSNNKPDIFGYEMKKNSSKITFGDFSASEYLFSKNKEIIEKMNDRGKNNNNITREEYIKYFGTYKSLKNRYSWSGSCVPTYGIFNYCGQMLKFNDNLDLCIYYSFENDTREYKNTFPNFIQYDIIIAIWEKNKLEKHINDKFNKKGFFICKKVLNTYEKICFGKSFDFNYFVDNIKNKNIIFDSGMYQGNSRNYSQFRSTLANFWNILITEEY